MAAVLVSAGELYGAVEGEIQNIYWESPSTMDSADTVDLSAQIDSRNIVGAVCWDRTNGDSVTVTDSSGVLTLDAAGGDTDAVFVVHLKIRR